MRNQRSDNLKFEDSGSHNLKQFYFGFFWENNQIWKTNTKWILCFWRMWICKMQVCKFRNLKVHVFFKDNNMQNSMNTITNNKHMSYNAHKTCMHTWIISCTTASNIIICMTTYVEEDDSQRISVFRICFYYYAYYVDPVMIIDMTI